MQGRLHAQECLEREGVFLDGVHESFLCSTPAIQVIVGVTAQLMPLMDRALQVLQRGHASDLGLRTQQTQRAEVSGRSAFSTHDVTPPLKGRLGCVVKGERDNWH